DMTVPNATSSPGTAVGDKYYVSASPWPYILSSSSPIHDLLFPSANSNFFSSIDENPIELTVVSGDTYVNATWGYSPDGKHFITGIHTDAELRGLGVSNYEKTTRSGVPLGRNSGEKVKGLCYDYYAAFGINCVNVESVTNRTRFFYPYGVTDIPQDSVGDILGWSAHNENPYYYGQVTQQTTNYWFAVGVSANPSRWSRNYIRWISNDWNYGQYSWPNFGYSSIGCIAPSKIVEVGKSWYMDSGVGMDYARNFSCQ
ncbi:hypothetical protein M2G82_21565, partial [Vibrio vulnificus]|nr:hypothetical protein [Vibrio vulnificus]